MPPLTLSNIAIGLGLGTALLHLPGVLKPATTGAAWRQFSRCTPIGWLLMLLATGWFLYYVSLETVSDFANIKDWLYYFFAAVGLGTCLFVRDFLAVRGLAVLLLLMAKLVTDKARLVESDGRLVLVLWAYVWVWFGMWLTISPWRLRDWIEWMTASEGRFRLLNSLKLLFGLGVVALGWMGLR